MEVVAETRILVNFYNLLVLELNGLKPNEPQNNILLDFFRALQSRSILL